MKIKAKNAVVGILIASCLALVACTQSQLQQAEALTQVILQDIPAVLEILAGAGVLAQPQLTQAQAAAGQASADFSLVQKLISDYQATPSVTTADKIRAALGDAETNLQAILTAARVTNPKSQATITGAVTLIINTASQIAAIFPAAPTLAAVRASNTVKLPTVKAFQAKFHAAIGQ